MSDNEHLEQPTVPRMATIKETVRLTGIPEYALRRLVREKRIVYIMVGNRVMVNVDRLIDYLNTGEENTGGDKNNV